MNGRLLLAGVSLLWLASACTPGAVNEITLTPSPVEAASFLTLDQVVPYMEDVDPRSLDMDALSRMGVIGGRDEDSFAAMFSLHEYPDLLYLDVWFYNRSEEPVEMAPEMMTLLDGGRTQFRYLAPHEAANLMLSQRRGAVPYEPKRAYEVETYNYGTYSRSTVREVDAEPFAALGNAIGNLIRSSRNAKLTNAAAVIYAEGLVPGTLVAPDAAVRFGVQWLNRPEKPYPLEIRVPALGYRISFQPGG